MQVYLDNAATTPIDPAVRDRMVEVIDSVYGNPSSIHEQGRQSRTIIEKARKQIAQQLSVAPGEVFFTSGGTEADNMALNCAIFDRGVNHIITTKIEHDAVLHPVQRFENLQYIQVDYVRLDENGHIDLNHLEELLQQNKDKHTLVSLMHANNELGNLLNLEQVGQLCEIYQALFHSDTVQTVGHIPFDVKKAKLDFITASAHKFHGPKGVGFIYINNEIQVKPFIYGGSQERNMRGGTENIYGIAGLAKAMEIAYNEMDEQAQQVQALKTYMKERLQEAFPDVVFNGDTNPENSLYTVLNVGLPPSPNAEMLLFNLDIEQVSASGGSACSSGSDIGSHVLHELLPSDNDRVNVRFSFSKLNTKEEIDYAVDCIKATL
jgi:cysteine desulfurase